MDVQCHQSTRQEHEGDYTDWHSFRPEWNEATILALKDFYNQFAMWLCRTEATQERLKRNHTECITSGEPCMSCFSTSYRLVRAQLLDAFFLFGKVAFEAGRENLPETEAAEMAFTALGRQARFERNLEDFLRCLGRSVPEPES